MKTRAFSLNICNIYTALWSLYLLQGTFYSKGGPFGRFLILLISLLSLYYFVSVFFNTKHQPYLKALNALVLMFTIYGLYSMMHGTVVVTEQGTVRSGFDFIKQYYSSILPIYAYYSFAKEGYLDERWFSKWVYVFIVVAIAAFFIGRQELLQKAMEMGLSETEFTNNFSYLFVALIPAIAISSRKPMMQWAFWLIVIAFSLFSFKRGAILTTGVCFLYYLRAILRGRSRKVGRYWVLALVVFIAAYFMVEYLMSSSDYFMFRLERTQAGSLSSRDELYGGAINAFKQSSFPQMLFGHGANSTATLLGNGAHNDWLEILICHGLFGVLLFVIYWITLFKTWLSVDKQNPLRIAIGLFFVATFLRTLFSFSIGDMSYYTAAVVGYCLVYRNKPISL